MQNQAIQYLALDVHKATTVATLRDAAGGIVMRSTVRTEAQAILGLSRSAGKRVHVVFEEGTQAQWLYDLLRPHVERVVVCNVRGRDENVTKSDNQCLPPTPHVFEVPSEFGWCQIFYCVERGSALPTVEKTIEPKI